MIATNFKTLDLNLLRVFDEVMTERSLTRAARKLSITQPAVSNAMKRLREAMGDELIKRSGQAMAPTPRALALWPAVREALRQLQDIISPSTFVPGEAQATFVLAMADATSAELLPGLMAVLERDAPQLSVRVVPLVTRDPRPLLEQDGADMAIGYFPSVLGDLTARAQAGETVAFATRRLLSGEYVCAMRHDHPLSKGPLTLNRFCSARHVLVSYSGRPFGFIDEALAILGRERHIALTVNQFFTAGTLAAQSDMLTGMPRHFLAVSGLQDQLTLRDLPFAVPPLHIDALWHHRRNRDSAHEWLRQTIAGIALTPPPEWNP
jgi:DNA-binding transcriptional LysR family regulator